MSFDGRAVANFVLDHCAANNRAITNLALQKVVYFCHVWSLVELGQPLVRHQFEAWQHGPVLQYLYQQFKEYDRSQITGRAVALDRFTGKQKEVEYNFDEATTDLLKRVVDFYSRLSAGYLVELSHAEGGPWDLTWNHGGKVNPGMKIDDQKIADFYSRAVSQFRVQ